MTVKKRITSIVGMETSDQMDTIKFLMHEWITIWNRDCVAPRTRVWKYNNGTLFENICDEHKNKFSALIDYVDQPQKEYVKDVMYAYCGGKSRAVVRNLRYVDKENRDLYRYRSALKLVGLFDLVPVFDTGVWRLYSLLTGDIILETTSKDLAKWAKENDCLVEIVNNTAFND